MQDEGTGVGNALVPERQTKRYRIEEHATQSNGIATVGSANTEYNTKSGARLDCSRGKRQRRTPSVLLGRRVKVNASLSELSDRQPRPESCNSIGKSQHDPETPSLACFARRISSHRIRDMACLPSTWSSPSANTVHDGFCYYILPWSVLRRHGFQ